MIHWIARRRVAVTGCDTWNFELVPAENLLRPFIVPPQLNTHFGVVKIPNLHLRAPVRKSRSEFMFVISRPKPRNATGAWTAPSGIQ